LDIASKVYVLLDLGDGIENASRKKYERAQQALKIKIGIQLGMN
jgi:hypothetical protein